MTKEELFRNTDYLYLYSNEIVSEDTRINILKDIDKYPENIKDIIMDLIGALYSVEKSMSEIKKEFIDHLKISLEHVNKDFDIMINSFSE